MMSDGEETRVVREKLSSVGVQPSSQWLGACLQSLASHGPTVSVSADAVLQQLVHHDLRDVVRGSEAAGPSTSSQQLRRAVVESTSKFVTLPVDFKLLLQVEEVLDVSRNAQDRLKTNVSSSPGRCLKLLLTDGYNCMSSVPLANSPTNTASSHHHRTAQARSFITAMETSPISSLSSQMLAGTKLCLHGKIRLRHGALLLDDNNVTLIGGVVDSLVQIQKQALDKAQREAGVGVDPTVRALVRDDGVALDEQEDEGEQESSDVVVTSHPPQPRQLPQNRSNSRQSPHNYSNSRQPPQNQPQMQPAQNHYSRQQQQQHPNQPMQPPPTRLAPPPAARPNNSTLPPAAAVTVLPQTSAVATTAVSPPNATFDFRSAQVETSSGPPRLSATVAAPPAPVVIVDNPQSISFPELRELLARVCSSKSLYERHESKLFRCCLKQHGPKIDFSIAKNPLYKKGSGEEKYVYYMLARFQGASAEEGLLTCKISNSIMEPFFGKSPTVMRKLNREQRELAAGLVKEGGSRLNTYLSALNTYEIRLSQSADKFFAIDDVHAVDGLCPVIELKRQIVGF